MIFNTDINGQRLHQYSPSEDFFDDIGDACMDRYRESLDSDFLQLIVVYDNKYPVGYCSYWTEKSIHFSNDKPATYYQINYIYVRESYQNRKIASLMAVEMVNNFFTIDHTANYSDHYCDNSNYISDGGLNFGNKVYSLLAKNNKQIG